MSDSKINIKLGNFEFSSEGQQEWVSAQLDKVLEKMPSLVKIISVTDEATNEGSTAITTAKKSDTQQPKNLSLFLKEKNATSVQTKKFLATAAFLQMRGSARITTADVSKALKDANQNKLNNASDCLNQNITKGSCEKDGTKNFFVTDAGMMELGIPQ